MAPPKQADIAVAAAEDAIKYVGGRGGSYVCTHFYNLDIQVRNNIQNYVIGTVYVHNVN